MTGRFQLGRVLITSHAQGVLHQVDVSSCLMRHLHGDWGELSAEDKAENEFSVKEGFRILSSYRDRNKIKFWIITEADRSSTTVLLPDDY
jgi:hypothetical protein